MLNCSHFYMFSSCLTGEISVKKVSSRWWNLFEKSLYNFQHLTASFSYLQTDSDSRVCAADNYCRGAGPESPHVLQQPLLPCQQALGQGNIPGFVVVLFRQNPPPVPLQKTTTRNLPLPPLPAYCLHLFCVPVYVLSTFLVYHAVRESFQTRALTFSFLPTLPPF